MKAIIFFSLSKDKNSKTISESYNGNYFEIKGCKNYVNNFLFQLIYYGYLTVFHRKVCIEPMNIDYSLYDEIVLITPIWAGQPSAFMRQFLQNNPFKNKKVTLIGSCKGGYKKFFNKFNKLIDRSNIVTKQLIYIDDQFKEEIK